MINTYHIIHLIGSPQTSHPPLIAGLLMIIPAIERIAPKLTSSRECIRRTASYCIRLIIHVKLEKLRICPNIGAVSRNINWNIANNLNALIIGILLQIIPLLEELKLHILLELYIKVKLLIVVHHSVAVTKLDILCPFSPVLTAKSCLNSHKQSIIIEPPVIFIHEIPELLIFSDFTVLICLAK